MFSEWFPNISAACRTPGGCLKVSLLFVVVAPLVVLMPPLPLFFLLWHFFFCRYTERE